MCDNYGEEFDAAWDEVHSIRNEINRLNAWEFKKLIPYLEEYSHSRNATYERRLTIDHRGRLSCQGAILQPGEERKIQTIRLRLYQLEMRIFTKFLETKFFS